MISSSHTCGPGPKSPENPTSHEAFETSETARCFIVGDGSLGYRAYRLSGGNCKTMKLQGRGNNVRDNRPDNVRENGRLDKRVE